MPDADYARCKYAVTCYTEDLAVLHCLRALSQFAEGSNIPKSIPWGGTKESEWRAAANQARFRFTSPAYRAAFLDEARRLLPPGSFKDVASSDIDPASRRRT